MSELGGAPATREQRSSPISTVMVSFISQLFSFLMAAAVLLKQQSTLSTKSIYVLITQLKSLYVFLFWELHGVSPNINIHVSVSDSYIPRIGPHISCYKIGISIVGIYKLLTETWMRKPRLWPRNSISVNICFKFLGLVLCSVYLRCWRQSPCRAFLSILHWKNAVEQKYAGRFRLCHFRYPKLLTENSAIIWYLYRKGRK